MWCFASKKKVIIDQIFEVTSVVEICSVFYTQMLPRASAFHFLFPCRRFFERMSHPSPPPLLPSFPAFTCELEHDINTYNNNNNNWIPKAFAAKDPPWGRNLVTILLTVLPFAYIGLAARVLTRSNRLGKDDDGVGRAVARGGELVRYISR